MDVQWLVVDKRVGIEGKCRYFLLLLGNFSYLSGKKNQLLALFVMIQHRLL